MATMVEMIVDGVDTGVLVSMSDADGDCSGISTSSLMEDSIRDQINVMLHQETDYYPPSISCQSKLFDERCSRCPSSSSSSSSSIEWSDAKMIRMRMTEWAYAVVDSFCYNRVVVAACLNFVDRYTTAILEEGVSTITRKTYQGIFVVALYVALKLQGSSREGDAATISASGGRRPPSPTAVVNISVFADLSRGMLTVKKLEAEERHMMSKLRYRLNPPVFGTYIEYFILFLVKPNALQINPFLQMDSITTDAMHFTFEVARYLTELATFNVNLTTKCRPSCVSAASILYALDYLRQKMGNANVPQNISAAFESNILRILSANATNNGPAADIRFARAELQEICPAQTLDAWPGGWPSSLYSSNNEEPPKDQIVPNAASQAPDSPLGVADAELI